MPVKINAKSGSKSSVQELLAQYHKKYGHASGNFGGLPIQSDRIPTGIFPFDLATGGGLPRGRCSILYGAEDSCKTTISYKALAMHQKLWPELTNVYVAIEPFDPVWAGKIGVDTSKLVVLNPSFAEEAVDMTEEMLMADDCGLVVVDSLGALITTQEAEKSAEGANVGGQGLVAGKMVRKTGLSLREAEKAGRKPSLLYINQTRYKIGVMYGDPETMPGGKAPLFQAQLRIRLTSKAIKDSKISDMYPVRREVHFVIKKAKVPLTADNGKFELVTYPHEGLSYGDVVDIDTVEQWMRYLGAWEKGEKKGWVIASEDYPTQQAFKDRLYYDKAFGQQIRSAIINDVMLQYENKIQLGANGSVDSDGVVEEEA